MDALIPEEWHLSKRQQQLLKYGSVGAAGLYFLYRVYRSDSLTALIELRERLHKSLDSSSKSFLVASECSSRILRDLEEFLISDSDELPQSLKQLAKLAKSQEVSEATASLAAAAARGAFSTRQQEDDKNAGTADKEQKPDILQRLMDLLTQERGMNLVQLAVSVACRSTVSAYCEAQPQSNSGPSFWQQLLDFGTTPNGEKLYSACIGTFVREGTKEWMGGMEGVSGWEDFLSNLCKPERQQAVDRLTRTFVNELVVSYLKRSRHGLRSEGKASKLSPSKGPAYASHAQLAQMSGAPEAPLKAAKTIDECLKDSTQCTAVPLRRHPEWTDSLVEAVKVPEVRNLVLSVAKAATGEGVRTSIFTTRDLLFGAPVQVPYTVLPAQQGGLSMGIPDVGLQQISTRSLGTLLLFIFMPIIIFLAGRRAALA